MRSRLLAAVVVVLVTASVARSHQDPGSCFSTGVQISVGVFRSDGVTGVVGTVQDCEQLVYRTVLSVVPSPGVCAFSGGTFSMTTPDAVVHTISSSVPCLGGTSGEGCVSGTTSLASGDIPYTVSPADVSGGFIQAQSSYSGGVSHDSPSNTSGVSGFTPKNTPVVACAATTTTPSTTTTTTTLPKSACTSTKLVTASKLVLALAKCQAKAVKGGVAFAQACRDTAIAKFTTKFTTLDTKPDCLTSSDAAAVQAIIDACSTSLTNSLVP